MRRGEEERPRPVIQKLDEVPRAGHVAAERPNGLRKRAHLNVHAAVHVEVVDRASAIRAKHAARMRVVHHHDAAEFLREVAEFRQPAKIAIHAEDAVGDEQLALSGRQFFENRARCGDILVREDLDRGAAQPACHQ